MIIYIIMVFFSIILIFISILVIDYLIKYIYILYWINKYKILFDIFFDRLSNKDDIKIRRKNINGHYIFSFYNFYNTRYIEFSGDSKGNINLLGGIKDKYIKTLTNYYFHAPTYAKVPFHLRKNYNYLINKYDKKRVFYLPSNMKDINTIKNNGNRSNDKKLIESIYDNNKLTNREKYVKNLSIKVLENRNKDLFIDLNKIIDSEDFINKCIHIFRENDIITENEINNIITDKIHDYASFN